MIVKIENNSRINEIRDLFIEVVSKDPNALAISMEEILEENYLEKNFIDNCIPFVYMRDNKIVGFVSCVKNPRNKFKHIVQSGTLLVHPDYQNGIVGIGAKLLLYLIKYLKNNGYKVFEIMSKPKNYDLYQKIGFKFMGEMKYGFRCAENPENFTPLGRLIYEF